jgi:hypothetical protein
MNNGCQRRRPRTRNSAPYKRDGWRICLDKHGTKAPAAYRRDLRLGHVTGIPVWVSRIRRRGSTDGETIGVCGWIFPTTWYVAFGHDAVPDSITARARRLTCDDPRIRHWYITLSRDFLLKQTWTSLLSAQLFTRQETARKQPHVSTRIRSRRPHPGKGLAVRGKAVPKVLHRGRGLD